MRRFQTFCVAVAAGLALTSAAVAQDAAPYAVPTEVITTGKASGAKFLEASVAIAGYKFFTFGYSTSDGVQVKVFGAGKDKKKNITKYRFVTADDTPVVTGKCLIRSEADATVFGFSVDQKNSGLYKCDFGDLPAADYALEVVVPQFANTQIGIMTIEKDEPHRWDVVKAELKYKGVVYEARPTGIDERRESMYRQPVKGYIISRAGQPVGRLDFDFTGVQSDFAPKGKVTAPVAETDGREAVIFFAAQLLGMPDVYKGSNAF